MSKILDHVYGPVWFRVGFTLRLWAVAGAGNRDLQVTYRQVIPRVKPASTGRLFRWTDELIQIMLAELTDNPKIKQGLFPGMGTVGLDNDGTSITKSNSCLKKEYHYMLAEVMLRADTLEYKLQFDNDLKEAAGRDFLVSKLKKAKDLMRETGARLTSEEQIDISMKTHHSMMAWSKVKKILPRFFTLALVKDPTSHLGTSPIETDASKDVDSADEKEEDELHSSEDDLPEKVIFLKQKQPSDTSNLRSTGSKVKGGSEKATLGKSGQKGQNPVEKFVDLTKAEELTT
ncbi:hypothetical protein C8R42DRAFT_640011 [Lentinula raphanica]|nr:hypothetical protein C8R42DRAFT_640011 [Lentinula raphanica]